MSDTTYGSDFTHVQNMPYIAPDTDLLTAALAYAGAGLYLAPTTKRGESPGKNPGTLLGSSWPSRTVTGAADAYALFGETFASEAVGIALHCGRSGLVVVDIDTEDVALIPEEIKSAVIDLSPPYQTTRKGGRARGHYFFRQPHGRRISNGLGRLPKGWGDIRGTNGVVILAGSWHPKPEGEYRQRHAGPIPELPGYLAEMLPDGSETHAAVTDSAVAEFIASTAHNQMTPNAAKGPVKRFVTEVAKGGSRHNEAAAAAVWIFREARAGGYAAGPAIEALWREFHAAVTADPGSFAGRLREGGPEREFRGIIAWAVAQALGEPEERMTEVRERLANPRTSQPPPATRIDAPAGFTVPSAPQQPPPVSGLLEQLTAESLTDAVVAQRIHDELLHDRFVWSVGFGWMKWTGKVWRDVPEETVVEVIRRWAVEKIKPELFDPLASKEVRQRLLGLLDKYRLKALAELNRGLCQVEPDTFDRDADLLNTQSGIVDLLTGEVMQHDASRHMTRITEAAYVPGATHEDWETALRAVPADVADWLQVRLGQAVTGYMTPDDVLVLLRGGGSNGKSTLLDAIKQALGSYGSYISERVLLAESGAHPTELTEFRGARFALTEELPDEGRLNSKRLKDIIGTPTMTARKIRQDSITWRSTHSMFLSTNYVPKVTETDNGTWRRLALVEFPYTYVPADTPDPLQPQQRRGDDGLRDRVASRQERQQAVLAWLVAGAQRWYGADRKMPPQPATVVEATRKWREQSDLILRFWNECLTPDPKFFISTRDMLDVFNEWLVAQGHKTRSSQSFTAQFGEHELTRSYAVEYRQGKVKEGDVQSFPPRPLHLASFGPGVSGHPQPLVGSKVRAWWGVRFVDTP